MPSHRFRVPDFFQTFTVYEGHSLFKNPHQITGGKRLKLARKMRLQLITLTATECRGFYSYFVQCYLNLKETIS